MRIYRASVLPLAHLTGYLLGAGLKVAVNRTLTHRRP